MEFFVVSHRLQAKNRFLQTFNTGKLKITLFGLFSYSPKQIKILLCTWCGKSFSKEGLHTTRISTMALLGRDDIFLFSNIFNPLKYCRTNLSSSFLSCSIIGACLLVCTLPLQRCTSTMNKPPCNETVINLSPEDRY